MADEWNILSEKKKEKPINTESGKEFKNLYYTAPYEGKTPSLYAALFTESWCSNSIDVDV